MLRRAALQLDHALTRRPLLVDEGESAKGAGGLKFKFRAQSAGEKIAKKRPGAMLKASFFADSPKARWNKMMAKKFPMYRFKGGRMVLKSPAWRRKRARRTKGRVAL
jgi:hypothetical protein